MRNTPSNIVEGFLCVMAKVQICELIRTIRSNARITSTRSASLLRVFITRAQNDREGPQQSLGRSVHTATIAEASESALKYNLDRKKLYVAPVQPTLAQQQQRLPKLHEPREIQPFVAIKENEHQQTRDS